MIVLVFFGIPTLYMVRMSFNLHIDQRLYVPGFTFEHYVNLFSNPLFTTAIWTTVKLSLMAPLSPRWSIGYGFALLVWLKPARWRLLFIGLALCPLLISEIAIIFGWWMFFPKNGLLSYALLSAGLDHRQDQPDVHGVRRLRRPRLRDAALLLLHPAVDPRRHRQAPAGGERRSRRIARCKTFREVLLPLTWTGILVAFSQSFIWTMGTYATPSALGPDTLWTMGFLIQEQMLGKHNWPMASALAVVLVVGVAAVMVVTRSLQSEADVLPCLTRHPARCRAAVPSRSMFRVLAVAFTVFIIGYILVPILVTLLMSFNDAAMIRFPITDWSVKLVRGFLRQPAVDRCAEEQHRDRASARRLISTTAGVLCAWAFQRFHIPVP